MASTWSSPDTLTNFSISYKDTLCRTGVFANLHDFDPETQKRDCEYPTLNAGWLNQSAYKVDDCSIDYLDVFGGEYAIKCIAYMVTSLVSWRERGRIRERGGI